MKHLLDTRSRCIRCGELTSFQARDQHGVIRPACMEHCDWTFRDGTRIPAVAIFERRMDLSRDADPVIR